MRYLTISQCPTHNFWAISIDDKNGGTRLTQAKCCGRWKDVKRFPMTAKELRAAARELECNAEQIEQEEGE